jgi:chitinase
MRGKHPISKKNIRRKAASFTLNDTVNLLVTMRACVGMLRYLDHTGTPNVNRRLTDVVNNVGAQWNHGQAVWNAANPNNRVFVGDFWSEWVQDYYPAIILHVETYVQYAIDQMRQYWGVSTDARAPAVLNILASLESQLGTLTINTAGMN